MIKGIFDKYDQSDSGWIVRYKVEENGLNITKSLMLHPNQVNYAEIDKECEFDIKSCPNFANGGVWEDMAVVYTGEGERIGERIGELIEKFKGKIMFPKMVERAKESLKGVETPNPNSDWEEILFNFIDEHPCILPHELFEWLEKNYEVPKIKHNVRTINHGR